MAPRRKARPQMKRRCVSRSRQGPTATLHAGLLALCCLVAAGCGSSKPPKPLAQRVCSGAHLAATAQLGSPITARILDAAPADLRCVLSGHRLRVVLVSQATAQAYTEWDTEDSHQSQVFGPGVHEPGQIPVGETVRGAVVAVWIPAQNELVATDAMLGGGGAYVTVTVTGRAARGSKALALARAVAAATFAAHPDAGE